MPVLNHAIKQLKTHPGTVATSLITSKTNFQKGLPPRYIFALPALHVATPSSSTVAAAAALHPFRIPCSSLLDRQQNGRRTQPLKCYAVSPESDSSIKQEINNRGNSSNNNNQNSVEIETAKELAARDFTWFDSSREILSHTGNDPGHWNFSPEWWGSQGGSFGRTDGQIVFSKQSKFNGLVEVTAHPASLNGFSTDVSSAFGDETRQEWRVLRFNNVTRQSVARVAILSDGGVDGSSARLDMQQRRWLEKGQSIIAQPDCVAAEYVKTITAVFAALVGLQGLFQSSGKSTGNGATTSPPPTSRRPLNILCLGVGGGTLPHFIAHHFPQAHVDAVEIDPVVVEAAIEFMGLPVNTQSNLTMHTQDAFDFINARCGGTGNGSESDGNTTNNSSPPSVYYDVVCIDAFDGEDNVPSQLVSSHFAGMLGQLLDPRHGTLLVNLHDTMDVDSIGKLFYDSLVLGKSKDDKNSGNSSKTGCCFVVDVQRQRNTVLACARGLDLPLNSEEAKNHLKYAAVYVGHESGYRFPAGVRAERNFKRLF
jgi:hypothetical protein